MNKLFFKVPSFAKIFEQLNIGASKKTILTINAVKAGIIDSLRQFAAKQKWTITNDSFDMIEFQVGEWGFNIEGAQKLRVYLTENGKMTVLAMESKSKYGQLLDWDSNQKNLDTLCNHLKSIYKISP